MSDLLALDVAVLLPRPVAEMAVRLSASLPSHQSQGLRLDRARPPHITLTQQFVAVEAMDAVLSAVGAVLRDSGRLPLSVAGACASGATVWMAIDRTPMLQSLHERLMEVLRPFERDDGGAAAFVEGDARSRDVSWVAGYRQAASFAAFTPHVTLGHAERLPVVPGVAFEARSVAACHLGRFCTCRRVLQRWTLR